MRVNYPVRLSSFLAIVVALFGLALFAGGAAAPRGGQSWLRVNASDFTLITSLREKEAKAWAGEFSQFIAALHEFIPVDKRRLPKLTIVVFGRDRDFDAYRPLGADGKPQAIAGFFSRRESWSVAGLASSGLTREMRTTIFHEGTHWFLSAFEGARPVWLEEGLAEVFSTFEVDKKHLHWGRAIEEHVQVLNVVPRLPLEQLMFLTQDQLHGHGEAASIRTGLAYAQSWALVHYLVFGQRDVPQRALADYARLMYEAISPDEAFRRAFGSTYEEMDKKLAAYLRGGRYFVARKPLTTPPELKAEPATESEIEEALARLSLAAGRHAQALDHATRMQATTPNDPSGDELIGQIHAESGQEAKAAVAFEQAVAKGSRNFLPHYVLAATRHRGGSSADGGAGNLDAVAARQIANGYERAINLHPRFLPAYQGLAGVVELLPPENAQDRQFLELGQKLFPTDGMIRLGLAVIARKAGDETNARTLLDGVLERRSSQPHSVRRYAERLDERWTNDSLFKELHALTEANKHAEALALLDRHLAGPMTVSARQRLIGMRRDLKAAARMEEAREAWEAKRWEEARQLLTEVVESDAPPRTRTQAKRRLEDLDRRKLGQPK